MTPDEAIDAIMRGPFDGIGRFDHVFEPPCAGVEAAMRGFLRAFVEAAPDVEYDAGYDAMHGISIEFHASSIDELVSVSAWNDSAIVVVCGPAGEGRLPAVSAPRAEAASLVPAVLERLKTQR